MPVTNNPALDELFRTWSSSDTNAFAWGSVSNELPLEDDAEYEECARCGVADETVREDYSDFADEFGYYGSMICEACSDTLERDYHDREDDPEYDDEPRDPEYGDLASEIEVFEPDAPEITDGEHSILWLPALEHRQARMISFEQEVSAGASHAARALYNAGLSQHDRVQGYHSGNQGTNRHIVYVERDASVDGEIIWSKLKLHQPATAAKFEEGINIVRGLIADGTIRLDMHCGGHLHVDARGLNMPHVMSLYVLWNYLEDTMFRLAAANWSGHRSQRGNDYSPNVHKGLKQARELFAYGGGRAALNLGNLISARSSCHCGATQAGTWDECVCTGLRKPTIEFRVWNTTANLRKINAYTALSLAMIEYSRENVCDPDHFPEFGWAGTPTPDAAESERRLQFVLEDLPLTDRERDNVRYCIDRCSLAEVNH